LGGGGQLGHDIGGSTISDFYFNLFFEALQVTIFKREGAATTYIHEVDVDETFVEYGWNIKYWFRTWIVIHRKW